VMTAPEDTTAWDGDGGGNAETGVVPPPVETVAAVELAWSSADDSPVHQSWRRTVFHAAVLLAVGVVLAEAIWATATQWVAVGPVVVAAPSRASTHLMSPLPTSGPASVQPAPVAPAPAPATTVTVTAQPPPGSCTITDRGRPAADRRADTIAECRSWRVCSDSHLAARGARRWRRHGWNARQGGSDRAQAMQSVHWRRHMSSGRPETSRMRHYRNRRYWHVRWRLGC
jgi:hypothetical protein